MTQVQATFSWCDLGDLYWRGLHEVLHKQVHDHVEDWFAAWHCTCYWTGLYRVFKHSDAAGLKWYRVLCLVCSRKLSKDVGIPANLNVLGVKPEDYDILATNAMKDACGLTNPKQPSKEEIIALYKQAYEQEWASSLSGSCIRITTQSVCSGCTIHEFISVFRFILDVSKAPKFQPKPPCSAVCLICLSVSVRVLRVQLSLLHSVQCITKDKHKNCRQHLYIMQHFRCVNICHWCQ